MNEEFGNTDNALEWFDAHTVWCARFEFITRIIYEYFFPSFLYAKRRRFAYFSTSCCSTSISGWDTASSWAIKDWCDGKKANNQTMNGWTSVKNSNLNEFTFSLEAKMHKTGRQIIQTKVFLFDFILSWSVNKCHDFHSPLALLSGWLVRKASKICELSSNAFARTSRNIVNTSSVMIRMRDLDGVSEKGHNFFLFIRKQAQLHWSIILRIYSHWVKSMNERTNFVLYRYLVNIPLARKKIRQHVATYHKSQN